VILLNLFAIAFFAAEPAATVTQTDKAFTLSNGYLTAQVDAVTGDLTSLQIRGVELMGYASGHHAGYWEQSPARAQRLEAKMTIDPKSNGGERAEVSVKGYADGKPLSGMICDLEIRYAIARGEKGLYTYAIFSHPAAYGATQIGESRFGAKLSAKVFDWLSIDDKRNTLMPAGAEAVQSEIPASTKEKIGLYFINPSREHLSSGPLHPELTGHLDKTPAATRRCLTTGAARTLAYPGDARLNWQNDARHYEFWTQGDSFGHFRIPNARPGKYQLHAIADGVFGELAGNVVTVEPGKSLDLGKIEWKPVRYGRQIWEIGLPNREVGLVSGVRQAIPERRDLHNREERLSQRLVLRTGPARNER
jgi:polysaccharide lyase family 4-like protein/rhamnogalacturonate lyase-like protein